jgi:bifunctional DNA-binding transcriptional regulator/antitoxin component of YhaV-PrlF toxin-antitoxin module
VSELPGVLRLTAKRQVTLPKRLCAEMGLQPVSALVVDDRMIDGRRVWLLRPAGRIEMPWFGRLKRYGKAKRHDMASVRQSIAKARREGRPRGTKVLP